MDNFSENEKALVSLIHQALAEDIGLGDHTSLATIPATLSGIGSVRAKSPGIISGVEVACLVARALDTDISIVTHKKDGEKVDAGTTIMELTGRVRSLLSAERLLLNCMQRMSGIATMTRAFVDRIDGTGCKILDTRKTTPNFRLFEKMAVKAGGGHNHRFGLYDMILIKDNHVDAAGGILNALERTADYQREHSLNLAVEIETRNLDEVRQVLESGHATRIMLDNFSPSMLRDAIKLIDHRMETEASGGITIQTVREYAETGVDYVSVGALSHSYKSLDISMKIRPI
ncbi:MAG: carboxylating nicotinate-nucleotide diphosphorylase [Bacteroidota bacterium]